MLQYGATYVAVMLREQQSRKSNIMQVELKSVADSCSLTLYSCCSKSPSLRLLLGLAALLLLLLLGAATAAVLLLLLPLLLLLAAVPLPLLLLAAGLLLCLPCCV